MELCEPWEDYEHSSAKLYVENNKDGFDLYILKNWINFKPTFRISLPT